MSEKEVKHILDTIKESKNLIYSNCHYLELDYKDQQALNDYINELKKEIEELKGITKTYDSYIGEKMPLNSKIIIADREYFMNGTFVNKFISKDKIRDKMKEYSQIIDDCEEILNRTGNEFLQLKKNRYVNYYNAYKELLEER